MNNKPLVFTLLALVSWQLLIGSSFYMFSLSFLFLAIIELEKLKKQKKKNKELKIIRSNFERINRNFECMLFKLNEERKDSNNYNDNHGDYQLNLFTHTRKGGQSDEPLSDNKPHINDC